MGVIRVERSWDERAGEIEPKSAAGRRTVPIPAVLLDYLAEHKARRGRDTGLVFGTSATHPFTPSNTRRRARRAWARENEKRIEDAKEARVEPQLLEPIGLHEARHTYASLMIAADVNAKTIAAYMGHSSITITLDRYGHLMPGNESEAAAKLDAFLERADTAARLSQLAAAEQEERLSPPS